MGFLQSGLSPALDFFIITESAGSGSAINKKSSAGDNPDWRKPIIDYLSNPSERVDRDVRRMAFKYTMGDDVLYRRTVDDVLLKFLDEDQARVAMGEVHEGICGTH